MQTFIGSNSNQGPHPFVSAYEAVRAWRSLSVRFLQSTLNNTPQEPLHIMVSADRIFFRIYNDDLIGIIISKDAMISLYEEMKGVWMISGTQEPMHEVILYMRSYNERDLPGEPFQKICDEHSLHMSKIDSAMVGIKTCNQKCMFRVSDYKIIGFWLDLNDIETLISEMSEEVLVS